MTGGATVVPFEKNVNRDTNSDLSNVYRDAPYGFGPGINRTQVVGFGNDVNPTSFSGAYQQFGNYTLIPGTSMIAVPCGASSYKNAMGGVRSPTSSTTSSISGTQGYGVSGLFSYTWTSSGTTWIDATTAVLGQGWENLQIGDTVNVKVIHTPTGKVIYQKDIPVTEA